MAAPSATLDELASTEPSVEPTNLEPSAMDGTVCPAMLHIVAPQPKCPIAFGTDSLAEHAFAPPPVTTGAAVEDSASLELDVDLAAGVNTMVISRPTTGTGDQPLEGTVAQEAAKPEVVRPPPPARPTLARSYSTRSSPFGRPVKTRIEKRKRTPQACERCRQRKTKCDGARPHCARCTKLGAKCDYVLDHKAVRSQLRKLQKEGLLPESIPLDSGSVKTHGLPVPMTATLSSPARMTSSGTPQHPGYALPQASPRPWARAPKRTGALPQRLTVPMLSSGSSSGSSSNTPLVTPTEEGSFQLGAMQTGLSVMFGTPIGPPKPGYQPMMPSPNYPPPIMPYPGRSFPLFTTSGEYFDEARLVPELCGAIPGGVAIPANAYIVPHIAVNPGIKAKAIWMDASVPGLGQDNAQVWAELFGRE